jgi:hypothetical protein
MQRKSIAAVVLALILGACAADTPLGDPGPTATTGPVSSTPIGEAWKTEILVQATMHLLRNDTTFGDGYVFPTVLIVESLKDGTPLTADQIAALTTAVSTLSDVRFISSQDDFVTDDLRPTIEGAAIITLGPPDIDGNEATIDMGMWCGGLCGIWLTYALEVGDAGWEVLGTVGPIAIS